MNRLATFRDGRLNALVEGVLGTTRTLSREMLGDFPRQRSDDSDSDCLLDTSWYEDDSPLDDDELLDFFAAADRSLKESLSFEDILSVVDLLAFDEVDEGELRLQFDLAASSGNELKNSHHKGELDLAQFRCFVSKVVSGLNERGRWPHPPSHLHPSLVIFRRRVTWRLDEEPTMVDAWMRRVMLPVLVLWNLAYVWVWLRPCRVRHPEVARRLAVLRRAGRREPERLELTSPAPTEEEDEEESTAWGTLPGGPPNCSLGTPESPPRRPQGASPDGPRGFPGSSSGAAPCALRFVGGWSE
ncbi:unnamed protein product [Prorocentrum cordatum]|uniref:Calmodulin n=1 Tax=Prorocentrum cordatum TaxID=2364126 RepID=A0ABN9QCL9_9DINO|nr:unnamed protein product [Polarella glacialis]